MVSSCLILLQWDCILCSTSICSLSSTSNSLIYNHWNMLMKKAMMIQGKYTILQEVRHFGCCIGEMPTYCITSQNRESRKPRLKFKVHMTNSTVDFLFPGCSCGRRLLTHTFPILYDGGCVAILTQGYSVEWHFGIIAETSISSTFESSYRFTTKWEFKGGHVNWQSIKLPVTEVVLFQSSYCWVLITTYGYSCLESIICTQLSQLPPLSG